MNYIVSDIQTFACHNNMKLNPEKCKEIIVDFLQYNATKWQPICINGKQVEVVTVFKLLGVYLSSDLTWTAHCKYIIKKANRRLYALRKLEIWDLQFWHCGRVLHCDKNNDTTVFANLSQTLSKDLERVQKRAMSIIYPSHSYMDALSFACIQTLCVRREEACNKFVANIKASNPLYPFIHKQLPTLNHDYSLRSATTERQPIIRTDRFESFITVKYRKTEPWTKTEPQKDTKITFVLTCSVWKCVFALSRLHTVQRLSFSTSNHNAIFSTWQVHLLKR